MKKYKKILIIGSLLVLFFLLSYIISLSKGITIIDVISEFIIFIVRGFGEVVFTPYLLLIIAVLILFINPEGVINILKRLSAVIEQFGFLKFRNPNDEKSISLDKLEDTINTSNKVEKPKREEINFYKILFTKNGPTTISRQLLFAIDQPDRPSNFNLKDLVKWTYGKRAMERLERENSLYSLSYPASLLIQVGALEGKLNMSGTNNINFESIDISPSAKQALNELVREGFKMKPEVHFNN